MDKNLFQQLKWAQRVMMRIAFFPFVFKDYLLFKKLQKKSSARFDVSVKDSFPFVLDKTITTPFDRHYIYHTSWAARKVKEINPTLHVDISSSLSFSSIVSAFVPVKFYDYRPAILNISNYTSERADLTGLHFESNSIDSLSCMHTVEHIGLGRYGDHIDPDGDIKAIQELQRVTAKNGNLLFVVPVGKPILRFNGLRIYSYEQIISMFDQMELKEFSLIHEFEEDGGITLNASPDLVKKEAYGCGCFWFIKK